MTPQWLEILSIISLISAGICAVIIIIDLLAGHKQSMWIMNLVWPITALYLGPVALWIYFGWGRSSPHQQMMHEDMPVKKQPSWKTYISATTHCGAGCVLGDIIAEWLIFFFPFYLFGSKMFAAWTLDYVFAFLLGIAFQYYTIKPMKNLSPGEALKRALKSDALSITFWQIGMYGWMAIAMFLIFRHELRPNDPVFWFMMQIAMCFGFLTSYPTNIFLIKRGIKAEM